MKRIFVSLCVVMMILLAGCGQTADSVSETISQASDLNKAGYIIGVPEGTPPEEVAKEFMPNADISYFTQFMDGVAALKSGKGDVIISDFFKTDERGQEVLYTDAYVMLHNSVLVQKSRYAGAVQSSDETAGDGENQTAVTGIFGSFQDSFNKTFIVEDRYQLILQGLWTTVVISLLSLLFGSILGALICAMRRYRSRLVAGAAIVYIRLIQGVPIVLTLMILYYIIFASVDIDPVLIAVVGFSINFAAYSAEIFRTAIDATDKGQLEAAYAMNYPAARNSGRRSPEPWR